MVSISIIAIQPERIASLARKRGQHRQHRQQSRVPSILKIAGQKP
jgi:hypothetical protein